MFCVFLTSPFIQRSQSTLQELIIQGLLSLCEDDWFYYPCSKNSRLFKAYFVDCRTGRLCIEILSVTAQKLENQRDWCEPSSLYMESAPQSFPFVLPEGHIFTAACPPQPLPAVGYVFAQSLNRFGSVSPSEQRGWG